MSTTTTTKYGMVVPNGDDLISNGDDLQRAWAAWLDANIATQDGGVIASRPAAGKRGKFWWSTDESALYFDTGATWVRLALTGPRREGRSFTMEDDTGPATTGLPLKLGNLWVPIAGGQATSLVSAYARVESGSVSWKVQRATGGGAWADIAGFGTTASPIVTTTTTAPQGTTIDPADVVLADGDILAVVVLATTSNPKGFSGQLNLEHN